MKLDFTIIRTLFRAELLMLLRDRRTIIVSVVLPIITMPAMLFSSAWTREHREQQLQETVYRFAMTGPAAATLSNVVEQTRAQLARESTNRQPVFRFESVATNADPIAALNRGDLHFILEGLTAEAAGATNDPAAHAAGNNPKPGSLVIRIAFRADRDDSRQGMQQMQDALRDTRRVRQAGLLAERGLTLPFSDVARVENVDLASAGQVAGLTLGRAITAFVMLFMLVGGAMVATDLLVGEKERGTLETLLTTGARRVEIIVAKHLVVVTVAVVSTLIQAVNILVYIGLRVFPIRENFAAAVSPGTGLLLFVLFLPIAMLTAGVLLLVSGYARSYKEAQLYFYPVCLLGIVPAVAPFLPGLPLRSAIVVVPIANLAVAIKEVLIGSFDWLMIAVSWLVTAAAAVWTSRWSVRALSAEKLITTAEADAIEFAGGPQLFGRHVLRWFALLWGVVLIVNNYLAKADVRLQLGINLVVLFFGATVLMIRRYRLNPRTALALRLPKPAVWPALLFAVPGGLLTGIGLFRLADLVIPVPPQVVEAFSDSLLSSEVPFGQLLVFVAVLPAVFEELTFRGVLLHGLHRRLHPAALVLVVGLVFGMFHVALFRLATTAYLGMLLAMVTLLTGSILPAMLWHALNNALGILVAVYKLPLDELDAPAYLAGAGLLAAALWVIWRNRTPYPGLRPWRRR